MLVSPIISIIFYVFLWSNVSRMLGRVHQSINKCVCTIFGIEIESLAFVAHAHYIPRSSCISPTCSDNIVVDQTLCVPRGGTRLLKDRSVLAARHATAGTLRQRLFPVQLHSRAGNR